MAPMGPVEQVTAGFEAVFGYRPEGVWAAPGRLNLIGEFTDYNDGFALPIALPAATRAAIARRSDPVVRVGSANVADEAEPVVTADVGALVPGGWWADYALGVLWATRRAGHRVPGLDVFIDSDVPIGAGLSSSAALECALALAVRDLLALDLSRRQLAALAQEAENAFVGVPTGGMDQMAALCCVAGHALLLDTRSGLVEQVPFDPEGDGLTLLVLDTGVRHRLVASAYGERRAACEEAARNLGLPALRDATGDDLERLPDTEIRRRARHVVTENARVLEVARLVGAGRTAEIGPILDESHRSLRDDFSASTPELDLAARAARSAGALGARMVGGGFGGCVVALARSPDGPAVADGVGRAFAGSGRPPPHAYPATPSGGARRVGDADRGPG